MLTRYSEGYTALADLFVSQIHNAIGKGERKYAQRPVPPAVPVAPGDRMRQRGSRGRMHEGS